MADHARPSWVLPDDRLAQGAQIGIREKLPFWMAGQSPTWDRMCLAQVPSPPTWEDASKPMEEAIAAAMARSYTDEVQKRWFEYARKFQLEVIGEHRSRWTQEDIDQWLEQYGEHLGLAEPLPKDIRLEVRPWHESLQRANQSLQRMPFEFEIRAKYNQVASFVVRVQCLVTHNGSGRFKGRELVTAEPDDLRGLTYWAAVIQSSTGGHLAVLMTHRNVDLGTGGLAHLWAWNSEVEVMLPVPAIRIDNTWNRLPNIISWCRQNELLFQAHRSGPGDHRGGLSPARDPFD